MSGIGVNLRVTGHCNQGGRKYMEDMFSVAYQQTEDFNDLEYAFFGIFDGHGGVEAATYAKEHLLDSIVQQKSFWSDNDDDVLHAIHEGYINTHQAMWKDQANWQRTQSGLPSTSGTTATVAFIMKSKIYVGHVGDSMLVLGYQDENDKSWKCLELTKEHKPECPEEIKRITKAGGKVVRKNGVPRVVWNRPKIGHKGPVRRSTAFDEIPFLAVARSLGDFWSYNSELDTFVVSPEPDVGVIEMDTAQHKCLIFGTDGLWNMLSAQDAVDIVHFTEVRNEQTEMAQSNNWINPSKCLVDEAIEKWRNSRTRADNTSVVTLLIDPPGPPPRPKTIKSEPGSACAADSSNRLSGDDNEPVLPQSGGMAIFTRSPGSPKQELLNSLFKQSATVSSTSTCSNKNRIVSNILRPYDQLIKSKPTSTASTDCSSSSSSPALSSPSSSSCSYSAPPLSPTSSGSLHSMGSSASIASTQSSLSTATGTSSDSVRSSSRNSGSSNTATGSASSTRSGSSCSSNSTAGSVLSASTRSSCSSNSTAVNNLSASVPTGAAAECSTNSTAGVLSASVAGSSNSATGGASRPGRVSSRSLTNQMAVLGQTTQAVTLTSSKRKRFRMDEKRSSLPLNMGFEESSGNSDVENERLSVSPQPEGPGTDSQSKTHLKKQKVETERRHLMSNSTAAHQSTSTSPSPSTSIAPTSTRTLRSDTIAAIPIKTLRSRNVNMGRPGAYLNGACAGSSPRSKSLSSTLPSGSTASPLGGKKLRWNKR
ncbi:hypothetical protein M8J77_014257 [Diaphorina citri]|nr:hypothetical protein M8J77_014257 [Diaphorina citri]